MKKMFLSVALATMAFLGTHAQGSFETALSLNAGANQTTAVEVGYYKGAYFMYTATETCVLSVRGNEGESFSFYNADQSSNWSYTSSYDATGTNIYSIKVAAGETIYVFASQSYSATGSDVSFNATIATGVLEHGMSADDAIALEMGRTYWFENGKAYFTYTAQEKGVVVFTQPAYCYGATYTVDGKTTDLSWASETKEMSMPVEAGKTYAVMTSASSSSIFSVSARFTQPKQGDTVDDPFTMTIGQGTLPAAAQKYYYRFTNDDDLGFLTVQAEGCTLGARSAGYTYNNLADDKSGSLRLLVDMDQEVYIVIERTEAAEAETSLNVSFELPQDGDLESKPIILASSETEQNNAPVGETYYSIKNEGQSLMFLNVIVDSEGISSYGSSQVKVYPKGNQWGGSSISSDELLKVEVEPAGEYIVYVKNVGEAPIAFRAWTSSIEAGDTYALPIVAALGENTVAAAGQKFYSYTAGKECKLAIKVGNAETTTLFFPTYAEDEYYGRDLISNKNGEYVVAAREGETVIFRMTGAQAGEKFTITEKSYEAGETRLTAIPFSGTYQFDDLAPYKTWLVYTAEKDGKVTLTPSGFTSYLSYSDNIYFCLNEGSEYDYNMRGYDAEYNTVMNEKTIDVEAGDKLYIHIDVQSLQEEASVTLTFTPKENTTGIESPLSQPLGGEEIYNLSGQRLNKTVRGLNIIGGKKVLVK